MGRTAGNSALGQDKKTISLSRTVYNRLIERQARRRIERDRQVTFSEIIGELLDIAAALNADASRERNDR